MLFMLRPSDFGNHYLIEEKQEFMPPISIDNYLDSYGNVVWRTVAPEGEFQVEYNALVATSSTPDLTFLDLPKTPIEDLPSDVIMYTLPSRSCPSDLLVNDAWELFGNIDGGWAQVQAVCNWIHNNIEYGSDSTASSTALDTYQYRRGICRDFAHLAISFCRALNFPARYVCGYLPDIDVPFNPTPMDFHAWFEVYMDGMWCTFDARHNTPRIGRILIARGRDAVDTAFSTIYGNVEMLSFSVWSDEVDEQLNLSTLILENNE